MSVDEVVKWKVEGLSYNSQKHAMIVGQRMAERMPLRGTALIEGYDASGERVHCWYIDRKGDLTTVEHL